MDLCRCTRRSQYDAVIWLTTTLERWTSQRAKCACVRVCVCVCVCVYVCIYVIEVLICLWAGICHLGVMYFQLSFGACQGNNSCVGLLERACSVCLLVYFACTSPHVVRGQFIRPSVEALRGCTDATQLLWSCNIDTITQRQHLACQRTEIRRFARDDLALLSLCVCVCVWGGGGGGVCDLMNLINIRNSPFLYVLKDKHI